MSELGERRWAVISERGCEASGLVYEDAAQLVQRLRGEKVSGLCVVTDGAARLLIKPSTPAPNGKPPAKKSTRPRKRTTRTS